MSTCLNEVGGLSQAPWDGTHMDVNQGFNLPFYFKTGKKHNNSCVGPSTVIRTLSQIFPPFSSSSRWSLTTHFWMATHVLYSSGWPQTPGNPFPSPFPKLQDYRSESPCPAQQTFTLNTVGKWDLIGKISFSERQKLLKNASLRALRIPHHGGGLCQRTQSYTGTGLGKLRVLSKY